MKYLSKLLSMFLVGAMLYSTGCTDYETDINNLKDEVDQIKQELNGQIDALATDLGAEITALEGAIDAANKAIAENKTAIDALKAADVAMDARVKAAEEAIVKANADIAAANAAIAENADAIEENAEAIEAAKKSIEEAVAAIEKANEAIKENADAIEALKKVDEEFAKDIETLESNLETLETELKAYADELLKEGKAYTDAEVKKVNDTLNAHIEAFTAYQGQVAATIAALEARVAANEEAIAALQTSVEELYELHDVQAALIEDLDGRLELFMEYTEQELQALRDADAALAALIAANTDYIKNVENSLIDYQKIANEQFTKAFGQIAENLSKINALEAALEAERTERIAMGKSIHEHIANVQTELKGMIAALDKKYAGEVEAIYAKYDAVAAELAKDIEDLNAKVDAQKADLESQIARVDEHIAKALNHAMAAVADVDAKVEDLNKAVNKEFESVRKELAAAVAELEADIAALSNELDAFKSDMNAALWQVDFMLNVILNRVQSIVFVPEYSDGKGTIKYAKAGNAIVEARSQMVYQVYPAECASLIAYAPEAFSYLVKDLKNPNTRGAVAEFNIVDVKGDANGLLTVTFDARNLGADFYAKKMEYAAALVLTTEEANLSTVYTNVVPATPEKITMAIYDGENVLSSMYPSNVHKFRYNETDRTDEILPNHVLKYTVGGKTYTEAELNAAGYALTSTRTEFARRAGDFFADNVDPFKYELVEGIYNVSVGLVDYKWISYGVNFGYKYVAGGLTASAFDYCVTTPTTAEVEMASLQATWTYSKDVNVDAARFNKKEASYERVFPVDLAKDVVAENLPKGEGNPSILEVLKWDSRLVDVVTTVKVLNGDQYEVVQGVDAEYIVTEKDEVKFAFSGFEWDKKYLVETAYTLKKASFFAAIPFLEVTFTTKVQTIDRNRKYIEVNYKPTTVDFTTNLELLEGQVNDELKTLFYNLVDEAYDAKTNYDLTMEDYLGNCLNKEKETFESEQTFTAYGVNDGEVATYEDILNNQGWVATGLAVWSSRYNDKEPKVVANYYYGEFEFVPASIEFEKTITTWYGQEFVVTKTLNFDFSKANSFDFKHNEFRVFEDPYYSQVQPEYTWADENETLIEKYDVAKVELLEAFYVVDTEGNKIAYADLADYANYNMAYEFVFEAEYSEGITMSDDFKISYYGSEDSVDVAGKLYMINDNGAKYQIPTSFDKGGIYADYYVQKFNPIGELIVDDVVVDVMNSKIYEANVFEQIELWDFRSNGRECYPIIADGAWVVGNGVDNGFAEKKTVQEIYGIYWKWYVDYTEVPADVVVKFDDKTGVLSFVNTQQIALTKEFTVPVSLEIYNIWSVEYSQKPITVNVTFKPVPVQ